MGKMQEKEKKSQKSPNKNTSNIKCTKVKGGKKELGEDHEISNKQNETDAVSNETDTKTASNNDIDTLEKRAKVNI